MCDNYHLAMFPRNAITMTVNDMWTIVVTFTVSTPPRAKIRNDRGVDLFRSRTLIPWNLLILR